VNEQLALPVVLIEVFERMKLVMDDLERDEK
jgi:hypothetical protein